MPCITRTPIKFIAVLVSLVMLLPARAALADTGPKPSMEFQFTQQLQGEQVTIISGFLYECDQPDCSDGVLIEEVGPQGFYCQAQSCSAVAYGFAPHHRIEIEFSDGQTRRSNVFKTAGFDSRYTVTIRSDDLLVEAEFSLGIFPRTGTVLVACACGILGLVLVVGLAVFLARRSKKD